MGLFNWDGPINREARRDPEYGFGRSVATAFMEGSRRTGDAFIRSLLISNTARVNNSPFVVPGSDEWNYIYSSAVNSTPKSLALHSITIPTSPKPVRRAVVEANAYDWGKSIEVKSITEHTGILASMIGYAGAELGSASNALLFLLPGGVFSRAGSVAHIAQKGQFLSRTIRGAEVLPGAVGAEIIFASQEKRIGANPYTIGTFGTNMAASVVLGLGGSHLGGSLGDMYRKSMGIPSYKVQAAVINDVKAMNERRILIAKNEPYGLDAEGRPDLDTLGVGADEALEIREGVDRLNRDEIPDIIRNLLPDDSDDVSLIRFNDGPPDLNAAMASVDRAIHEWSDGMTPEGHSYLEAYSAHALWKKGVIDDAEFRTRVNAAFDRVKKRPSDPRNAYVLRGEGIVKKPVRESLDTLSDDVFNLDNADIGVRIVDGEAELIPDGEAAPRRADGSEPARVDGSERRATTRKPVRPVDESALDYEEYAARQKEKEIGDEAALEAHEERLAIQAENEDYRAENYQPYSLEESLVEAARIEERVAKGAPVQEPFYEAPVKPPSEAPAPTKPPSFHRGGTAMGPPSAHPTPATIGDVVHGVSGCTSPHRAVVTGDTLPERSRQRSVSEGQRQENIDRALYDDFTPFEPTPRIGSEVSFHKVDKGMVEDVAEAQRAGVSPELDPLTPEGVPIDKRPFKDGGFVYVDAEIPGPKTSGTTYMPIAKVKITMGEFLGYPIRGAKKLNELLNARLAVLGAEHNVNIRRKLWARQQHHDDTVASLRKETLQKSRKEKGPKQAVKGSVEEALPVGAKKRHSRRAPEGKGYEVSSKGDKRFSAMHAKLSDGRTIEAHYQVDVKGYDSVKAGKGKPPKDTSINSYGEYLKLWKRWADENPALIEELRVASKDKVLTDQFANTEVNQARALADILGHEKAVGAPESKLSTQAGRDELAAQHTPSVKKEAGVEGVPVLSPKQDKALSTYLNSNKTSRLLREGGIGALNKWAKREAKAYDKFEKSVGHKISDADFINSLDPATQAEISYRRQVVSEFREVYDDHSRVYKQQLNEALNSVEKVASESGKQLFIPDDALNMFAPQTPSKPHVSTQNVTPVADEAVVRLEAMREGFILNDAGSIEKFRSNLSGIEAPQQLSVREGFSTQTIKQLKALAEEDGISLRGKRLKADIVNELMRHEEPSRTHGRGIAGKSKGRKPVKPEAPPADLASTVAGPGFRSPEISRDKLGMSTEIDKYRPDMSEADIEVAKIRERLKGLNNE